MPKIATIPFDGNVTLQDYIVGTDPDDSNKTRSYLLSDIATLFGGGSGLVGTLEQVTANGNSSTNGVYITGASSFTNTLNLTSLVKLTGTMSGTDGLTGSSNQVWTKTSGGMEWRDSNVPTLQEVTDEGNTTATGITLNTLGLTANAASLFNEAVNFVKDIQLGGSSGTIGQVLVSGGAGVAATWQTLADIFSFYTADGSITDAVRTITGSGANTVTFTGFGTFSVSSTIASINTSGAASVISLTDLTLSGTDNIFLKTPKVVAGDVTLAAGHVARLVDPATGEVEYGKMSLTVGAVDTLPKWDDLGVTLGDSTIKDDGNTAAFNGTPSASRQVSISTSVSEGLRINQSGTVNPTYGISIFNSGVSSGSKYGLQSIVSGGAAGSEMVGLIGVAGATGLGAATIGNTSIGLLAVVGDGAAGQDSYGAQIYAIENNADDNYGLRIGAANSGAGNSYLGLFKDGNEALGKVITSGANGEASWGDVPVVAVVGIESIGAGANSITLPTEYHRAVYKTAITGGGDTDTLPNPAGMTVGQVITLKDSSGTAGTDNWTVATFGAATILDGSASVVVNSDYGGFTIQWDGTNFNIISNV